MYSQYASNYQSERPDSATVACNHNPYRPTRRNALLPADFTKFLWENARCYAFSFHIRWLVYLWIRARTDRIQFQRDDHQSELGQLDQIAVECEDWQHYFGPTHRSQWPDLLGSVGWHLSRDTS